MATDEQKACQHTEFAVNVAVNRFEDTDRFNAELTVKCGGCGLPFRFIGPPAGIAWDQPRVSIDGTELIAPMEPALVPELRASASYQMPPELTSPKH